MCVEKFTFTLPYLSEALLDGADLSHARLSGATASGASFVGARLVGSLPRVCTAPAFPRPADPRDDLGRISGTGGSGPVRR